MKKTTKTCVLGKKSNCMLPSSTKQNYKSAEAGVAYLGLCVADEADCIDWLKGPVRKRAYDAEEVAALNDFMRVEGFDDTALHAALMAPDEQLSENDIGEAMAELALQSQLQAIWPTNRRRDMRSVRASLPGADIVGFIPLDDGGYRFLFAEVKTSSDLKVPPAVMYGNKGLEYQLCTLATDWRVLRRLLSYTYSRVRETSLMPVWREAFKRLADEFPTGAELVGVLVRDTTPQAKDVAHHAGALSGKLPNVDCVSLLALYICVPAKNWSLHCTPL
ncbi:MULTISPECIES: hypothetical protein [Burkholderia]|uniref:hypothetical protein n=1 Tax=Burkholderia TaxID=32008 RepID=UPI0021BEC5AA|nr:hypothetical protein [Burkholderia multivorans]MCA8225096.1 hypothetical protein [Burkholderia multivorans]